MFITLHAYNPITKRQSKTFKCNFPGCSSTFNKSSNMKNHLYKHNLNDHFKCSTCGHKFTQKGNLRRHELKIHQTMSKTNIQVLKNYLEKINAGRGNLRRHIQYSLQCMEVHQQLEEYLKRSGEFPDMKSDFKVFEIKQSDKTF